MSAVNEEIISVANITLFLIEHQSARRAILICNLLSITFFKCRVVLLYWEFGLGFYWALQIRQDVQLNALNLRPKFGTDWPTESYRHVVLILTEISLVQIFYP